MSIWLIIDHRYKGADVHSLVRNTKEERSICRIQVCFIGSITLVHLNKSLEEELSVSLSNKKKHFYYLLHDKPTKAVSYEDQWLQGTAGLF